MALIIETGAGDNPLAESYQSVEELRIYADKKGVNLNDKSNKVLEVALIKAMDYLEAQADRYQGYKANAGQPLEWPRSGVYDSDIGHSMIPDNEIPLKLGKAQCALAIESFEQDLQPNKEPVQKGHVIKEKVGELETVYSSDTVKQTFVEAFAKPAALLAPLYKRNGLTMVRS